MIGFIGLGVQGKHLALNILEAGHDLTVYDIRSETLEEFAAKGARVAVSPAEVGSASELVIVCVLNDAQVLDVVSGSDGLLATMTPGSAIAVHSTILPSTTNKCAQLADAKGIDFLEAPVSGSKEGAINRTMSYMLGGDEATIARFEPLLRLSGQTFTHTGPVGTASTAKLAHQVVISANMLGMSEGIRLGLAGGIEMSVLSQVISDGLAQSKVGDMWTSLDINPRALPVFYKDLEQSLLLAREVGVRLPGTALIQQMLEDILPGKNKEGGA